MKINYLELTTEFLTEQMNHWALFPAFLLIQHFAGANKPDLLMWTLTGLVPFLFFLVRAGIKNFWLFLGAHLAVTALSLLVPAAGQVSRLLCIFCSVCYLIRSLSFSLKNRALYDTDTLSPALAVAVSALAFLLHYFQGEMTGWEKYYMTALIGFFALYNIVQYLQHFIDFLFLNKSSAENLPVQEMLRSGLGLVLGYSLFGAAVMLLGTNAVWLEHLAGILKRGLLALLRALFSLFRTEEGQQEFIPEQAAPPAAGEMPFLPEGETFWLWKVLEAVVGIVLFCLFLYGVIRGLISLMRWIRRHFRSGLFQARKIAEEEVMDVREKLDLPGRPSQKYSSGDRSGSVLSPVFRIRRLYKKALLSRISAESADERRRLGYLTARESESRTGLAGMAEIYEQARYSERKLTGEDVRRMKGACSKKR